MFKRIEFDFFNDQGEQVVQLLDNIHKDLIKTAAISSELQYAINELRPKEKKAYILVNALGAGEYWGSNKNGDYFPEDSLHKYAKTFEAGHAFKHHVNKDPSKACGKVVFAHFNDDMHRVELLIEVDKDKAPDIIERLEKNANVPVSMGCRVPYDVCSICGNKAAKKAEYCEHITRQLNKVAEDGSKAYMINTRPRFFDISFVRVPADRTAYTMQYIQPESEKTAEHIIKFSSDLGEEWLKINSLKESDIDKKIFPDSEVVLLDKKDGNLCAPKELPGNFPKIWLDDVLKKANANQVLSTLLYTRIHPTPKDFQYILLKDAGFSKEAEDYYNRNIIFDLSKSINPVVPDEWVFENVSDSLITKCAEIAETHVLTPPRVMAREMEKCGFFGPPITEELSAGGFIGSPANPVSAATPLKNTANMGIPSEQHAFMPRNPLMTTGIIGGLYYGFNKVFNAMARTNSTNMVGLEGAVMQKPWLLPLLIGGASLGVVKLQRYLAGQNGMGNQEPYTFTKTATGSHWVKRLLLTVPGSYLYSGYIQTKVDRGRPINSLEDQIRRHPALTGALAFGLSGPLVSKTINSLEKVSFQLFSELDDEKFADFYEFIVN
jgi:hypothetical protein